MILYSVAALWAMVVPRAGGAANGTSSLGLKMFKCVRSIGAPNIIES